MAGPISLIERYYQVRKGAKLDKVMRQIDGLASMASLILEADFVAVFYRKGEGLDPIPVAYHSRTSATINSWDQLESAKIGADLDGIDVQPGFVRSDAEGGPTSFVNDTFIASNQFGYCYQYPLYVDDVLRVVVVGYWNDTPAIKHDNPQEFLELIGHAAINTMTSIDDIIAVGNFSVRLSQLVSMFEIPIGRYRWRDLAGEILRRLPAVVSETGVCLLARNVKTGHIAPIESVASEKPTDELIKSFAIRAADLANQKEMKTDGIPFPHDWTDSFADKFTKVIATEIQLEAHPSLVLVVWTSREDSFLEMDIELLSIYSLFLQTILNSALLVKSLRRANKLLKKESGKMAHLESVAAMSDMTSGVAHEFNNLIGSVLGRVQLSRMQTNDEALVAAFNKIETSMLEGADTVRRMQEFATRAAYKELKSIDLCDVVHQATALSEEAWKRLAVERNIQVKVKADINTAVIQGCEEDLKIVITRLTENAVSFAPDDSLVEVGIASDGNDFTITVSDNGMGIPREIGQKVFYPFFTTRNERGAGMGLAAVYSIVVRHGGQIGFESEPGQGTTFTVSFPQHERGDTASDISRRSAGNRKLSILVVDDDTQIREILRDMLMMDGHSATTCEDGFAALEAVKKGSYDMLITDLGMPGMTGLELAREVHKSHPEMPIALITGWGTQLDQAEAALVGVKSVMSKPFHLNDIKRLVEESVYLEEVSG